MSDTSKESAEMILREMEICGLRERIDAINRQVTRLVKDRNEYMLRLDQLCDNTKKR